MNFLSKILLLVLCLPLVLCCSVKEDRGNCPVVLALSVQGGDERFAEIYSRTADGDQYLGVVCADAVVDAALTAPKDATSLTAVSGRHRCVIADGKVQVPYGSEMDELYSCCAPLKTDGDIVMMDMTLHRQYAFAYITVVDSDLDSFPFSLSINANYCGFDMATMGCVPGPYRVDMQPVIGELHRICIPRQADNSIVVNFYFKQTKDTDVPEKTFYLGAYLDSVGYDWSKADLEDITLTVSYTNMEIEVEVTPWTDIHL